MEAWQLALLAWEGLKLVGILIGVGVAAVPPPAASVRVCYEDPLRPDGGPAVCPSDFTTFRLPEPGDHWMVRR